LTRCFTGRVNVNELYVAFWDGSVWQPLRTTLDATKNTLTVEIEHFTAFA